MKKILFAALFLSIANFGAALAQTQNAQTEGLTSERKTSQVQVRYQQTTRYDFDNEQVEGALVRPDTEMVGSVRKGRFSSMITVRKNFIPEMTKSVDDL